ncbi:MAG: DUF4124 domain-containing protein [Pseudomonadota bacterium]
MRYLKILVLVCLFASTAASADVWRWVDPNGKTHYVDSNKAIYVWLDETGRVFYSDRKDHDAAVLVQLIWHSAGTLADVKKADSDTASEFDESEDERLAREAEKAKNCKRATEIYDSYLNAPRLYRTAENGKKEYLSDREAEKEIARTKIKVDEVCS